MRQHQRWVLLSSLAALTACGTNPPNTAPATPPSSTAADLAPITKVCSLVSDQDVADAFDITGWRGQDVGPINGNPTDFRCLFKGPGYEFDVATVVLSSNLTSAQDALRVETGTMSAALPEDIVDIGDLAVYPYSTDALIPGRLTAVKRLGDGWRGLHLSGYYTPASTGERTVLPRDAIIQLARKIIGRM